MYLLFDYSSFFSEWKFPEGETLSAFLNYYIISSWNSAWHIKKCRLVSWLTEMVGGLCSTMDLMCLHFPHAQIHVLKP